MRLWLESDELLCLPRGTQGLTVCCEQGTAWLTQAGDSRDHILWKGRRHRLGMRGKVTIWADSPCVLRLEAPAPRGTLGLRWRRPRGALGAPALLLG